MSESVLEAYGAPFYRVFKFYMPTTAAKERWLQKKGVEVLDTGKDERGTFFFVGTKDRELAAAIQARIDNQPTSSPTTGTEER